MPKSKKQRGDFGPRDLEILKFLWKWKLAPTRALAERFFPRLSPTTAYGRLRELKRGGFIEHHALDSEAWRFVWTLSPKGFRAVLEKLPSLREEGYRSEHLHHDFHVTACHLGDWLLNRPDSSEFFTEQELRRYQLAEFPSWVPRTERHRPDGYWRVPYRDQMLTIALEVELKLKSVSQYEVLARFYDDNPMVARVVWLASSPGDARKIQDIFKRESPSSYLKHNFVIFKEFESFHWHATIRYGYEQGKSLWFALGIRPANGSSVIDHSPNSCWVSALLDGRKRQTRITTSPTDGKSPFSHCMALPAIPNLHTPSVSATLIDPSNPSSSSNPKPRGTNE